MSHLEAKVSLAVASLAVGLLSVVGVAGPAQGAEQPTDEECVALAGYDGSSIALADVESAVVVPAADGVPSYCDVKGEIRNKAGGAANFAVTLPLTNYNGRFYFRGCGGACGFLIPPDPAWIAKGYAQATTDMVEHSGGALSFASARNNREAEIDFAYRSTHETTILAKELITELYGAGPTYSYFWGGSTGGRQGLVEAQRYPHDYDGIVNMYPASNETALGTLHLLWTALANMDEQGNQILTNADAEILHKAALARCDDDDGLVDGLIDDPRTCDFTADMAVCDDGETDSCLTPRKAAAAQRIYDGPTNSAGERLTSGQPEQGSELNWRNNYIASPGAATSVYYEFGRSFTRDAAFQHDLPLDWDPATFDWDTDPARLGFMEQFYTATNTDLSVFKASGGKLLQLQGWADQSVVPGFTIDYYERTVEHMGGRSVTDPFYRLFMVPGLGHSAPPVDTVAYIENWVENGVAPDSVLATGLPGATRAATRPLFPYPLVSRYSGQGDIEDPATWVAVDPDAEPVTAPTRIRALRVHGRTAAQVRRFTWHAPVDDGGTPITGYRVVVRKGAQVLVDRTVRKETAKVRKARLERGRHVVVVRAQNESGFSAPVRRSFRVR